MPLHHNTHQQHKKLLDSKIIILGLFLILFLITLSLIKNINKNKIVADKTMELDLEIKKIDQENKDLQQLIAYFSTPEFLDKEAREKLNMAKPGEKIIIIPQENNLSQTSDASEKNNQKNYILWWNYFFNN
ncbi:MAG TPA: septum formation initiator family protein [bacterium]|nr:septum formation initiator family protein [bacterium]